MASKEQLVRVERGIFRRYDRYLVFVYTGKKSTYVGTFPTLEAARDAQAQARVTTKARVAQGKAPTPTTAHTFATYATDWLTRKQPTMKASTYRSTRAVVQHTLVGAFGARTLKQLTTAVLEDGFATLRRKNGTPFAPKSLRNIAQILRELLADAAGRGTRSRPVDRSTPEKG